MAVYERVVIVGVGLLGGSLGLALRQRSLAERVIGVGRNAQRLDRAVQMGAIDEASLDLERASRNADLAIICTPVEQVVRCGRRCQTQMRPSGLITDVGSTKESICQSLAGSLKPAFCGSHPLAGSEKSGVEHAQAELFEGRLTLVTPVAETPPEMVERTNALWQAVGSRTAEMTPGEHDRAIARTSHLPHLVAATLAAVTEEELLPLAASGWCDTTRVAAGNVDLWQQIILDNKEPVLAAIRAYQKAFEPWIAAIESSDKDRLTELLEAGKQKRDSVGN